MPLHAATLLGMTSASIRAGLQKEGAEEAELQERLEEVRCEEATLPAQIHALQAQLQADVDRVTQREGGAPPTARESV
jgi:hypothetical protein